MQKKWRTEWICGEKKKEKRRMKDMKMSEESKQTIGLSVLLKSATRVLEIVSWARDPRALERH